MQRTITMQSTIQQVIAIITKFQNTGTTSLLIRTSAILTQAVQEEGHLSQDPRAHSINEYLFSLVVTSMTFMLFLMMKSNMQILKHAFYAA